MVRLADRIAYLDHDLDDCLRSGLLDLEDVPRMCVEVLGERHSDRVGTMVEDVIARSDGRPALAMSARVTDAMDALKDFLFERIYLGRRCCPARRQVHGIIERLFAHYMESDAAVRGGHRLGAGLHHDARARGLRLHRGHDRPLRPRPLRRALPPVGLPAVLTLTSYPAPA